MEEKKNGPSREREREKNRKMEDVSIIYHGKKTNK